jgi:hypothetical protein
MGCRYRGWLELGNLRANGHPSGSPWRQFHCTACKGYFPEHHGTIFYGKQVAVALIMRVLACLAEGLGLRATARVFEVDPNTVLRWLGEAAEQLKAFSRYFLCAVHVEQVQLDELYAVLREVQAGTLTENDAIERLERSRYWVWTAMALLAHFGHWRQPERRQHKGPMPKPRWMPLPGLLYAQVVKSYRRRRIVGVKHRVVFGTQLAIEQVLAACGWTINTAFIERLNLDIRQSVAAVGRRVNTLCRGEEGLLDQMVLFQTYHNFVLPHASLRKPLPVAEATNGGSAKVWRPGTPAMAAGLTDHVWSLTEVLCYRVPPWPQPQTV